jgi:hypothetical protein
VFGPKLKFCRGGWLVFSGIRFVAAQATRASFLLRPVQRHKHLACKARGSGLDRGLMSDVTRYGAPWPAMVGDLQRIHLNSSHTLSGDGPAPLRRVLACIQRRHGRPPPLPRPWLPGEAGPAPQTGYGPWPWRTPSPAPEEFGSPPAYAASKSDTPKRDASTLRGAMAPVPPCTGERDLNGRSGTIPNRARRPLLLGR